LSVNLYRLGMVCFPRDQEFSYVTLRPWDRAKLCQRLRKICRVACWHAIKLAMHCNSFLLRDQLCICSSKLFMGFQNQFEFNNTLLYEETKIKQIFSKTNSGLQRSKYKSVICISDMCFIIPFIIIKPQLNWSTKRIVNTDMSANHLASY